MPHRPLTRQHLLILVLVAWIGLGFRAAAEEGHAHHEHNGDLLLFPAILGTHLGKAVSGQAQDTLQPEVDIFYSTNHDRLRFLAEFLLSNDEHDMERMQIGWLLNPAATLWFGRFHSPLGFWNSEHHHGAFLQTTISRPSILAFEDDSGVLPTHIFGALAEGSISAEHGDFNYAVGLGRGPELEDSLEPVDVFSPHGNGKQAFSGRLSYRKDNGGEFGAFVGHTRIPVLGNPDLDEVRQLAVGAFYNMETERLRFVGEVFRVDNRLAGPSTSSRTAFSAIYLQPEYRVSPAWTAFGRLEATGNHHNDPYLNLYPEFISSRIIAGSRIAAAKNQALKLELSHNERQDGVQFNQISLQWSMVYP